MQQSTTHMKINWLKLKNKLSTSLTVLKAIIALAIEVGIIIAVIHFKWYEKYPITALIVSNLVTMVIVYNIAEILKRLRQTIADSTMEEKLRSQSEKIQKLSSENDELKHLLDTSSQTIAHFNKIDFGVKIELMENTKIGYVVKEEKLEDITSESLKGLIPRPTVFEKLEQKGRDLFGLEQKEQSVLYIDKIYHKSTIGIDLRTIRYAIDDRTGDICLCGVELQVLHNASKDLKRDDNDISHCWITSKNDDGEVSVKHDKDFDSFREAYKEHHEELTHEAHIRQSEELCTQFTGALQGCLQQRYDNVRFISPDDKEYNKHDWHILNGDTTDMRVMRVLTDMHWGIKMIEQSYSEIKNSI